MLIKIHKNRFKAFTLSELLIALAILGVMATFAIPKVLQAQQDAQFKAIGKEAAGIISEVYIRYKVSNTVTANTSATDLFQYLNYVKQDSTTEIDYQQGSTTTNCSAVDYCYRLHNGAMLWGYDNWFDGTATTNAILFTLDPDGKVTAGGAASGPGKSVRFALYTTGMIRTIGTALPNTTSSGPTVWAAPVPSQDPPWFSWN